MSKFLTAEMEPILADEIEPVADPAFETLLRSLELERRPANPPSVVPAPITRREPYHLD